MKKNVILFLIVIICFCGCSEKKQEQNDTLEVEKVLEEYEEEQALNIEEVKINKLLAISKNYAVVSDIDNDIYIINSDNKLEGTIDNNNDSSIYQINDNGYVYQSINGNDYIYNKNGKKILSTDNDTKYYYGISKNNYLIRRVKSNKNTLKEEYSYEVVDINNKVIINDLKKELKINEKGPISIIYLGGNIYVVTSKDKDYLYNIKTNKSVSINNLNYLECSNKLNDNKNYEKCFKDYDNMIRINNGKILIKDDLSIINISKYDIILDDNYYYSDGDKAIKKYDGTVVKDLTIYEVLDVLKKDNLYYIATNKGLITFDKDFKEVGQITKLGKSIKKLTEYGIIVNKDTDKRESIIYDYNLNIVKDLDNLYLYDIEDFIAKVFIDGENNNLLPFNIKIKNQLEITN